MAIPVQSPPLFTNDLVNNDFRQINPRLGQLKIDHFSGASIAACQVTVNAFISSPKNRWSIIHSFNFYVDTLAPAAQRYRAYLVYFEDKTADEFNT